MMGKIMNSIEVVLGIDIGGTNTVFGLIDKKGKCHIKDSIPTNADQPAENLFNRLFISFNNKLSGVGGNYSIAGVGVGAPNANYYTGRIENPPNLSWKSANLVELIKNHIDLPVAVTNDANAAALGELMFGNAKGMRNFIEITLGTGLGSGIIVNGELVYGHDGFAGEMGHVTIKRNGRLCGCGRRGCLEAYVSATGITRTAKELLSSNNNHSLLRAFPVEDLNSKIIFEAAQASDSLAREAFEITGRLLGETLANTVMYFSPEAFFLSGGLAAAGDYIFKPIKKHMEDNLLPIFQNKVKILPSGLPMGEVAILGAGALIWHQLVT